MKYISGFVAAAVLAMVFVIPAAAQKEPSKDEWFNQIAKLTNTKKAEDKVKAYTQSKEFLAKYGKDTDDKVKKIRDFAVNYRIAAFEDSVSTGKMDDALEFGDDILADEPDNSFVPMMLAYGGFQAFSQKRDKGYSSKSITNARKALELLGAGKLPKSFNPFKDQAEATAWMHYIIGAFTVDFDLKEAASNLAKAVAQPSQIKDDTYPYVVVATYYEQKYEKQVEDYKLKHGAKRTEDAEMKSDQAAIDATLDRVIDAWARVAKLVDGKTDEASMGWKERLGQIYKIRHKDGKGLQEAISGAFSSPLKDVN